MEDGGAAGGTAALALPVAPGRAFANPADRVMTVVHAVSRPGAAATSASDR